MSARAKPIDLEQFLAAHGRALMRLAYLTTGSTADAEDLFQDTLADVHRNWSKVAAAAAPYAYVRRVLMNRHVSNGRRRSAGELPTEPTELAMPPVPEPTARVDSDLALWGHLAQLPTRMREILVLRYYEDLDDHTIAELLGIRTGTVRSSVSRALTLLRTMELS